MESKEVRQLAISVDSAFHISDHLGIEDMEHWAEAIGMQELFQRKILHAKEMRKRLESLEFLNVEMLQILSATEFKLTYRTLQLLTLQAGPPSKLQSETPDETDGASRMKVYTDIVWLDEDGTFMEMRSGGSEDIEEVHERHISDLTLPLTQDMAEYLAEGDSFNLYIDFPNFVPSNILRSLLNHLMAAIPADKLLFVWCPAEHSESPLEALIRHCRYHKLQEAKGQMHPNLEIHVVGASSSSSN